MKRYRRHRSFSRSVLLGLAGAAAAQEVKGDTTLVFDSLPQTQIHNAAIIPSFGDNVLVSGPGVAVSGFGTPDIDLTFGGESSGRWDFYTGGPWTAAQLDQSTVGKAFDITFTPTAAATVILKSFNLYPYYTDSTTYDYEWSVLDGETVLAGGQLTDVLADGSKTPVNIDYKGETGQTLVLRLVRTGGSGRADSIALDDLVFSQLPELPATPQGAISAPLAGEGAPPDIHFDAVVTDGQAKVALASLQLRLDGTLVEPQVTTDVRNHHVTYSDSAHFFDPLSSHQFVLSYQDNAVPAASYTNEVSFTVINYTKVDLPQPIYFEDFDKVEEGSLPVGWTSVAYIPGSDTNFDLQDLNSASYENWVVVNRDRFAASMLTYTTHISSLDYQRVLSTNPKYFVNGKFVENFATGHILFGDSGYRSGPGQYLEVFTPDFDLTGKTEVHLVVYSLWEQNQDSLAAIEYSIDQGQTWLPAAYFLDASDIQRDAESNIDAIATLTNPPPGGGTPSYVDPNSGETRGSVYADFIRAEVNENLAQYIQARIDDDPRESKRVEVLPLVVADNQPKVRVRFAHAGTDSWYFGIDNFGLYSFTEGPRLQIEQDASGLKITWTGAGVLQRSASPTGPWTDVPANQINGSTHRIDPAGLGATQYDSLR